MFKSASSGIWEMREEIIRMQGAVYLSGLDEEHPKVKKAVDALMRARSALESLGLALDDTK